MMMIHMWMMVASLGFATCVMGEPNVPVEVKSHAQPYPTFGEIERLDASLDRLIPSNSKIEKLAEGFDWSEGPTWFPAEKSLLFSDVPRDTIYRWRENDGVSVYMKPSGFSGENFTGREPGSNGLAVDAKGRLLICQHGDRRVAMLDVKNSKPILSQVVTIVDRWEGKRLNSPNDLVIAPDGSIYMTDPPYGLPGNMNDPGKEIPWQGVYRIDREGKMTLVTKELERPNGIGLSPDGKTLYVANSHGPRPIVMAFDVKADGTVDQGRVFFDSTELKKRHPKRPGGHDGMAVDAEGNVWATGPGGVLILSPTGKHLGTLLTGQNTGNCTFGGEDGRTLYITADMFLARVRVNVRGIGAPN